MTDEEYQSTPGVLFSLNDINYHKDPEQVKLWRKKTQERPRSKLEQDESEESYEFGEEDQQLLEEDEDIEEEEVQSVVNNYHSKSFRRYKQKRGSGKITEIWDGIKGVEERLCAFGLSSEEDSNLAEEEVYENSVKSEEMDFEEEQESELNIELSNFPVNSTHIKKFEKEEVLSIQRKYPKRTPCRVVDFPFNKSKIEEMRPVHENIPSLLGGGNVEQEVLKKGRNSKKLLIPEGPQTVCNFFKASNQEFKKNSQGQP